jgi:hypothetical protein
MPIAKDRQGRRLLEPLHCRMPLMIAAIYVLGSFVPRLSTLRSHERARQATAERITD